MNKVSNIIKENFDLKNELDSIIARLKENDTKHQGFKIIQFSILFSNTLQEINDKSLFYIEEIFDVDKAILFVREKTYDFIDDNTNHFKRIVKINKESLTYTFLQPEIKVCNQHSTVHDYFKMMPEGEDCSYLLCPVLYNDEIVAVIGIYSKDKNKFSEDHDFDFLKDLPIIMSIGLKKLNDTYLLNLKNYTHPITGLNNETYLEELNNKFYKNFKSKNDIYTITYIKIPGITDLNKLMGRKKVNKFIQDISKVLKGMGKKLKFEVGSISFSQFYCVIKGHSGNALMVIELIRLKIQKICEKHLGINKPRFGVLDVNYNSILDHETKDDMKINSEYILNDLYYLIDKVKADDRDIYALVKNVFRDDIITIDK